MQSYGKTHSRRHKRVKTFKNFLGIDVNGTLFKRALCISESRECRIWIPDSSSSARVGTSSYVLTLIVCTERLMPLFFYSYTHSTWRVTLSLLITINQYKPAFPVFMWGTTQKWACATFLSCPKTFESAWCQINQTFCSTSWTTTWSLQTTSSILGPLVAISQFH